MLVWGLDEEFGQEQLDLLSTLVRNEGGGLGDAVEVVWQKGWDTRPSGWTDGRVRSF